MILKLWKSLSSLNPEHFKNEKKPKSLSVETYWLRQQVQIIWKKEKRNKKLSKKKLKRYKVTQSYIDK